MRRRGPARGRRGWPTGSAAAACGMALAILSIGPQFAEEKSAAPHPRVDQKTACLACHEEIGQQLVRSIAHPPAAEGECTACHNPHVARFDALLSDRPGPLCARCHEEVGRSLERSHVHAPAAEGRCVDCHEPHGSERKALLTRTGTDLCSGCHEEIGTWKARPVQHPPFEQGECATCHESHGADQPRLARAPVAELCVSCHNVDRSFRDAHRSYPVERADCTQCHDPHASARPALFRASVHAPFADGECTQCHALPGSPEALSPRMPLEQLCGSCHEDQVAETRDHPFPHVSAEGSDCTACHNPHTASGASLLREPQPDVCLNCHNPGGSRSGEPGRYVTHSELECTSCHSPHGSDRPLLLIAETIELCSTCHDPEHAVSHPMGEATRDPRNETPMSCLSCHGMHDAPHPNYLIRSGDRDLCLTCHRNLEGGSR